jgi:alanyl-tRNA synthetase
MQHSSQSLANVPTSHDLRESFLQFFKDKGHTVLASSSLLPTAPNLLFTNSGMNPFVPHFLGETPAPYPRIANTQKCIRAGGKHNDLEDVGFDTYHHTFFEMLGNWSFGDYFKKQSLEWGWELLTQVWKFPKERLYATVYKPGEKEPASFDDEAYAIWEDIFKKEGMDPSVHIRLFGKKDNFWMMGETGPCGPCSEIHIDLTPQGDSQGKLVNADSPYCIEIWNHVFIQLNATPDGLFKPLAQKHVDTGMGFERVAGIIANTRNFQDFSKAPSNYASDLFQELFSHIAHKSGKVYQASIPQDRSQLSTTEKDDCIFRILADHIRTLCFAIADGILPGNEGRNYVIRRILRRAVLFGKQLHLPCGFFTELADILIAKMAPVFPELKNQENIIKKVIHSEEKAFEATLDRGLALLDSITAGGTGALSAEVLFQLYDTYGFPVDLSCLIAKERHLSVDLEGFESLMEAQRSRARAGQKKSLVAVQEEGLATYTTSFSAYTVQDRPYPAHIISYHKKGDQDCIITDTSPLYAEMGGQVGDRGLLHFKGKSFPILDTLKDKQGTILHIIKGLSAEDIAAIQASSSLPCELSVDIQRRQSIQRHHTATHLLHWALRTVLGTHVQQAGSFVGPDYLRFDFSHFEALKPEQTEAIQSLLEEAILANNPVKSYEVPFSEKPKECLSFFADKYGSMVRVVQIGDYSMELCGGTHVQATGEIGSIQIVSESAIAAGVRRIEAVSGKAAFEYIAKEHKRLHSLCQKLKCPVADIETRILHILEHQQKLEKQLQAHQQKDLANLAESLKHKAFKHKDLDCVLASTSPLTTDQLRSLASTLEKSFASSVIFLASPNEDKLSLLALCSKEALAQGLHAGNMVQKFAQSLGGKGGGKADFAMGACIKPTQLDQHLENFKNELLA